MPEYSREYSDGYEDGYDDCIQEVKRQQRRRSRTRYEKPTRSRRTRPGSVKKSKPRKLSGWQKFMKQKKNQIKYKSGDKKGRLNLKKMGVAYRKKKK